MPQRRTGKNNGGGGITREQYEALPTAFRDKPTVSYCAKVAQVSRNTAARYINEGDPRRGWPPIRERAAAITERAFELADETSAGEEVKTLELVRSGKRVLKARLDVLVGAGGAAYEGDPFKALPDLHNVEAALTGGVGERIGVGVVEDPLADLDEGELLEFLKEAVGALERYGVGGALTA